MADSYMAGSFCITADQLPIYILKEIEIALQTDPDIDCECIDDEIETISLVSFPETRLTDTDLSIYHESDFDPGFIAKTLSTVLRKNCLDNVITFTYSFYCSKPRPEHFGGGFVVVTKKGFNLFDTNSLIPINTEEGILKHIDAERKYIENLF